MAIEFSISGSKDITKIVKKIKRYRAGVSKKTKQAVNELAQLGKTIAQENFNNAEYDGTNDVTVYVEKTKDGTSIVAKGNAVAFIEFGTGITYTETKHPKHNETPGIVIHGSYGKGLGANPLGWIYKGNAGTNGIVLKNGSILTKGNQPNRCLYDTSKEIERLRNEIFKKEFIDE